MRLTRARNALSMQRRIVTEGTEQALDELLIGECRIPRGYVDTFEDVFAAFCAEARLDRADTRVQRLRSLAGYLAALADRADLAGRLTTVEAAGWCIYLFHGAVDRPDVSVVNLAAAWPATVPNAWVYAAAGLTPAEVGDNPPPLAGAAVLAGLLGFPMPTEL